MTVLHYKDSFVLEYFKVHQLLDVYECLITGLITVCPEEPLQWIASKIKEIETKGICNIMWDKYIPESMKIQVKEIAETYLEEIMFGLSTKPSFEMFATAYDFYWKKLKEKYFNAYKKYCEENKAGRLRFLTNLKHATRHFERKVLKLHFGKWVAWVKDWKECKKRACEALKSLYSKFLIGMILKNWHKITKKERKTKEYFENLEKHFSVDGEDKSMSQFFKKCGKKFHYLDLIDLAKCGRVCRAWRVLAGSSILWSNINFSCVKNHKLKHFWVIDELVKDCLKKYRPYIAHLNLCQCSNIFSSTLKLICGCCNLQDLNLYDCKEVNDDVMKVILGNCSSLLCLNISYCPISNVTLQVLGFKTWPFGHGCSKLVYLDVSGCCNLTSEGFLCISQCCCCLKSLTINDLPLLDDSSLVNLSLIPNIKALSMLGANSVTDSGLREILMNKKMQKLCMESARQLTDKSFRVLGGYCSLLTHLSVVACPLITDSSLRYLARLRHLLVVNLTDCLHISDFGVHQLINGYSGSKIRELNLTNCCKITDFSLMRIGQKCSSLSHLVLCYCERITDCGPDLLANLHLLSQVDLTGTKIGDKGFAALGSLEKLVSVIASECHNITDIGIEKFSMLVPRLEVIDLSHCMDLTDNGVRSLVYYCRNLTSVDVSGCMKLTDKSVQYLTCVCKYINDLNVSGCVNMTSKCIEYLHQRPMQLRYLGILYCKNINKNAIKPIEDQIDHIEHSNDPVPIWFNYEHRLNSEASNHSISKLD